MDPNITRLAEILQSHLGEEANRLGRETGFIRRQGKLTGSSFIQTLVWGFLEHPQATYHHLSQAARTAGTPVSSQALEQRFTRQAATFVQRVLERLVETVLTSTQSASLPLINRFKGVYLRDSTVIMLPGALKTEWHGNGGPKGANAAIKLQVQLNYATGALEGPLLSDGRSQDHVSPYQAQSLLPGTLHLADLGYYSLKRLAADQLRQVYWISRLKDRTVLLTPDGQRIHLLEELQAHTEPEWERPILLGARERIPCRLLVQRVPQAVAEQRQRRLREAARIRGETVSPDRLILAAWTLVVTNVPTELLSLAEALVLLRVRWQIELLFKLWKSHHHIDDWRSQNPERILCELYAKLIGVVIHQWVMMLGLWSNPRRSLVRAFSFCPFYAFHLAHTFSDFQRFQSALAEWVTALMTSPSVETRRQHPSTAQLILDFAVP